MAVGGQLSALKQAMPHADAGHLESLSSRRNYSLTVFAAAVYNRRQLAIKLQYPKTNNHQHQTRKVRDAVQHESPTVGLLRPGFIEHVKLSSFCPPISRHLCLPLDACHHLLLLLLLLLSLVSRLD